MEADPVAAGREKRRQDKLFSDFGALFERDKGPIEKLVREMLRAKE